MKIVRVVLIILGWLLIAFNVLGFFVRQPEDLSAIDPAERTAYHIGRIFAMHIFWVTGALFLFFAYRIKKKMKRKELVETIDSF